MGQQPDVTDAVRKALNREDRNLTVNEEKTEATISDYYQDNLEEQLSYIEDINDKIAPINSRSDLEEISELLEKLESSINKPFEHSFDPFDYHQWITVKTRDEEEALERTKDLTVRDAREYLALLEQESQR